MWLNLHNEGLNKNILETNVDRLQFPQNKMLSHISDLGDYSYSRNLCSYSINTDKRDAEIR